METSCPKGVQDPGQTEGATESLSKLKSHMELIGMTGNGGGGGGEMGNCNVEKGQNHSPTWGKRGKRTIVDVVCFKKKKEIASTQASIDKNKKIEG